MINFIKVDQNQNLKMRKDMIIVHSKECVKKLKEADVNKQVIVSISDEASENLRKSGIAFKTKEDYEFTGLEYEKRFWDQFEVIKKIENIKYNGKNLKEHLSVSGISIMDLLPEIYYDFEIIKTVKIIRIIDQIVAHEKPKKVMCFSNCKTIILEKERDLIPSMAEAAAKKNKVLFKKKGDRCFLRELAGHFLQTGLVLMFRLKSYKRKRLARYKLKTGSPTVLFINMGAHGKKMDITKPIHDELKKKQYNSLTICADGFRSDSTAEALMNEKMDFASYEHFSDRKIKRKAARLSKRMIGIWKEIKSNPAMFKQASFDGMIMFPVLENFYNNIIVFRSRILIEMILTMEKIYKRLKPSATVAVSDQNHFALAGIYVSRKSKVPNFTIQHGSSGSLLYPPNTEYFAVWSEEDKKNILKTMKKERIEEMEIRQKKENKKLNTENKKSQETPDKKHPDTRKKVIEFINKNIKK